MSYLLFDAGGWAFIIVASVIVLLVLNRKFPVDHQGIPNYRDGHCVVDLLMSGILSSMASKHYEETIGVNFS